MMASPEKGNPLYSHIHIWFANTSFIQSDRPRLLRCSFVTFIQIGVNLFGRKWILLSYELSLATYFPFTPLHLRYTRVNIKLCKTTRYLFYCPAFNWILKFFWLNRKRKQKIRIFRPGVNPNANWSDGRRGWWLMKIRELRQIKLCL